MAFAFRDRPPSEDEFERLRLVLSVKTGAATSASATGRGGPSVNRRIPGGGNY